MSGRLWHGGPPGLGVGDMLRPDPSRTAHLVDGCATCEARRGGQPLPDDDNDATLIYVTTDREYARVYAAGYPLGTLYRVSVDVPLDTPSNDPVPSWAVPEARVEAVYERAVRLTSQQLARALRRWAL